MNNSRLIQLILLSPVLLLASAIGTNAQLRTSGNVLEVIDGKTVVVAVPTGRITLELQYIDVPDPGQSLHAVVKDHVRSLLVSKPVDVQTKGLRRGIVTGKLVLNGVDVGQQLLRNGAAWHLPIEMSGQSKDEFGVYADSESLARQEKRGVWSVPDLEPAWQFRAKKENGPDQAAGKASFESKVAARKKGYWSDENPWLKDPGGLTHGFNAATQTGFLGMTLLGVKEAEGQPAGQRTAVDMTYYYTERGKKGRTGYFVVTVISLAENWRFARSNTLKVEADGRTYVVGKPKRETQNAAYKRGEKLTYRVEVAIVEKIARGGDVLVHVGGYPLRPRPGLQMLLYNMLQLAK